MVVRLKPAAVACMAALLAPSAVAQPDFAGTFSKLDADSDGVLSFGELKHDGVDAVRYAAPVASYVTDDGYGVELWETAWGIKGSSMSDDYLATRSALRSRTYPRDVAIQVAPLLMLTANPGLRAMSLERFEKELRAFVSSRFKGLDENRDDSISEAEVDRMFVAAIHARQGSPDFQTGPGGKAMRAHRQQLMFRRYEETDLDGDGAITRDEMLKDILDRLIAAYASPPA